VAALVPEADEWMLETFDKYLTAEVLLPHGGELVWAKVTGRKRVADGTPESCTRTPSWTLVSMKCHSQTDQLTAIQQT
jgi:hypothetical protein